MHELNADIKRCLKLQYSLFTFTSRLSTKKNATLTYFNYCILFTHNI